MPDADLTLATETLADVTVVRVAGELDLSNVEHLGAELGRIGWANRIVVDLSGCTFLDSSGLRSIVVAHRSAGDAGGSIALVATTPTVRRILEIAALDKVIEIHDTFAAALA